MVLEGNQYQKVAFLPQINVLNNINPSSTFQGTNTDTVKCLMEIAV